MGHAHVQMPFSWQSSPKMLDDVLLTILHANECWYDGVSNVCPNQNCFTMKMLLSHVKLCQNPHCIEPSCSSVKEIFKHWNECTIANECAVCQPLNMIRATQTEANCATANRCAMPAEQNATTLENPHSAVTVAANNAPIRRHIEQQVPHNNLLPDCSNTASHIYNVNPESQPCSGSSYGFDNTVNYVGTKANLIDQERTQQFCSDNEILNVILNRVPSMISMTTKRIFLTFLQSDEKFDNLLSFFPKLIESLTTTAILEVASNANIAVEENWLSVMEKYTKSHHKNMKSENKRSFDHMSERLERYESRPAHSSHSNAAIPLPANPPQPSSSEEPRSSGQREEPNVGRMNEESLKPGPEGINSTYANAIMSSTAKPKHLPFTGSTHFSYQRDGRSFNYKNEKSTPPEAQSKGVSDASNNTTANPSNPLANQDNSCQNQDVKIVYYYKDKQESNNVNFSVTIPADVITNPPLHISAEEKIHLNQTDERHPNQINENSRKFEQKLTDNNELSSAANAFQFNSAERKNDSNHDEENAIEEQGKSKNSRRRGDFISEVKEGDKIKYICNICYYSKFYDIEHMRYHQYWEHNIKYPNACHLCDMQFLSKGGLHHHLGKEHGVERKRKVENVTSEHGANDIRSIITGEE